MPAELYSLAAEQAVIGALLLDCKAWSRITGLAATDFYRPDHRVIFEAMVQLVSTGKGFDSVVLDDYLERRGLAADVGGLAYLGRLQADTPGIANIEIYAGTVRDFSLRRQLIAFAEDAGRAATTSTEDAEAILLRIQERLLDVQYGARSGNGLVSVQKLAPDFIDGLDSRLEQPRGLLLGLADFDDLTHGLEPGDLVVIAARPGMGKTALMVTVGAHVAQHQQVAVFSAEMPAQQLMRRCVALLGSVQQGRLRRADKLSDADWKAISLSVQDLSGRDLWIDDTAAPTLSHIRSESVALKARKGLGLVMIDYLQLVQGKGGNRYEELRQIAYGLKGMAKDLAVPVIALAQLNRAVESRDSKRPHASDLRDSGAIEEAADIIGLLYSESQYDPAFPMADVLECRIAKHRNGERGECLWSFDGALSRVTVLDDGDRAQYRRLRTQQGEPRRVASNDL